MLVRRPLLLVLSATLAAGCGNSPEAPAGPLQPECPADAPGPCCEARGLECGAQPGFECAGEADRYRCESAVTGEVLVPAGAFWMGCNFDGEPCDADEYPVHRVLLDAYAIDLTEVTAAAYKACAQAGVCTEPMVLASTLGTFGPAGKQDHPINFVGWDQASTFCAWSDKPAGAQRLCTEAEWEKAARGGCAVHGCAEEDDACCRARTVLFPWGNSLDDSLERARIEIKGTEPSAARPQGRSPYGAFAMAGNVEEWVEDWYAPEYYCRGPDATCASLCHGCPDGHIADALCLEPDWGCTGACAVDCRGEAPWATPWHDPPGPTEPLTQRGVRGGGFDVGYVDSVGGVGATIVSVRTSSRHHEPPDLQASRLGLRCCRDL